MERNGSPPFASFATLGQTSISETVLVSSSKERSPCARHSGAIPQRIGTAAVAGHFDEYPTTREEWSEPQGRNLSLCRETREQLTSMRPHLHMMRSRLGSLYSRRLQLGCEIHIILL